MINNDNRALIADISLVLDILRRDSLEMRSTWVFKAPEEFSQQTRSYPRMYMLSHQPPT